MELYKMNYLFRRNSCITSLWRLPTKLTSYSTVPNVAESQEKEETDKLYQTISIEMRANEPAGMKSYAKFAEMAAKHLDIPIGKCWAPAKPIYDHDNKLCLLRAAFVNSKARVQYEVRTYFRYMTFHRLTGSTADTFLEYLERNLPEGVALKITKLEIRKLPGEVTMPLESDDTNTVSNKSE